MMLARLLQFGLLAMAWNLAPAAEIYSNGVGGGAWDEPATWRGQNVPGPDHTVVIRKGDRIEFSQQGEESACHDLVLDPDAVLLLRPQAQGPRVVLRIGGTVDCYGTIQADLTRSPDASVTVRLAPRSGDEARITLRQRGELLLYGTPDPIDNVLNCVMQGESQGGVSRVRAERGAKLDLRWTRVQDVALEAQQIDSSGAGVREGVHLAHNQLLGRSSLTLVQCDTAMVVGNLFDGGEGVSRALELRASPLASVLGNQIRGSYAVGIQVTASKDVRLADNRVQGARTGVMLHSTSGVVERLQVRDCDQGLGIETRTQIALENSTLQVRREPLVVYDSDVQLTSIDFGTPPQDTPWLSLRGSSATLLNCAIQPQQIRIQSPAQSGPKPPVRSFVYLVVKVNGPVDAKMQVQVAPADAVAARGQMLVRQSPARLRLDGLTPLPSSRQALQVQFWSLSDDGSVTSPPVYNLQVVSHEPGGATPQVRMTQVVTPDDSWHRAEPDASAPTLEVSLP